METMSEYSPACEVAVPGVQPGRGGGWYLVAANARVEAGPFLDAQDARAAAQWMDDQGRGVNPGPWRPIRSRLGLIIGSRYRLPVDTLAG